MAPPCPPPPAPIPPPPQAPYVWPISAIAALGFHSLGYVWWHQHPLNAPSPALVPVALVTLEPAPEGSLPSQPLVPGNPALADPLQSLPEVALPAPLPPPDSQFPLPDSPTPPPSPPP